MTWECKILAYLVLEVLSGKQKNTARYFKIKNPRQSADTSHLGELKSRERWHVCMYSHEYRAQSILLYQFCTFFFLLTISQTHQIKSHRSGDCCCHVSIFQILTYPYSWTRKLWEILKDAKTYSEPNLLIKQPIPKQRSLFSNSPHMPISTGHHILTCYLLGRIFCKWSETTNIKPKW